MRTFRAYIVPLLVVVLSGGAYYLVLSQNTPEAPASKPALLAEAPQTDKVLQTPAESQSVQEPTESKNPPQNGEPSQAASQESNQDSTELAQAKPSLDSTESTKSPVSAESSPTQAGAMPQGASSSAQDTQAGALPPSAQVSQETNPLDSHTPNAPAPSDTASEKPKATYYANVTSLNIRALPSTSGRILGKLYLGQSVLVVNIQGEWAQLDSGGWVSLALLSPTEPSERIYIVLPNTLNIRAVPESSAPIIGALFRGQRIRVQQLQGEWAQLDSGGWVSLALINAL